MARDADAAALLRPRHGQFTETTTYPFTGATPTRLYSAPAGRYLRARRSARAAAAQPAGAATPSSGARAGSPAAGRSTSGRWAASRSRARPAGSWRRAPRRPALPDRPVGHQLHHRAHDPRRDARRADHRHRLRQRHDDGDRAGSPSSRTSRPDGTSYPLTEGALLGSLRAVNAAGRWTAGGMTVLPYHPYTQASAKPGRPGHGDRVPDRGVPDPGDDRRRAQPAAHALDRRHPAPHAAPPELPKLAGGVYTIAALRGRAVLAHVRDAGLVVEVWRRRPAGGADWRKRTHAAA